MDNAKTVLIIDDEIFLADIMRDKLMSEGFTVLEERDGEAGLGRALADRPDIILLDLVMPGMDGITMLKKLRQDEWGKSVPVVILSNLNNTQSVGDSLASGANGYLVKVNTSLDDLARVVKLKLGI